MGDTAWVSDLYVRQPDLFGGEGRVYRPRLDPLQVANRYIENVRRLFPYASRPVLMRNLQGASLYVLFLASHNERAVSITNSILKRYERLRTQRARQP